MVNAKKLPSGRWRVQVYSHTEGDKKIYKSFTADTKKEAELLGAEFSASKKKTSKHSMTVKQVIEEYISISTVLSPTTLSGYNKILKCAFKGLMRQKVYSLTDEDVQRQINLEARRVGRYGTISPKTVKNEWGLVASAIKAVCGLSFNIRLPKITKELKEIPSPEEVVTFIKGTDIELPCLLALWLSLTMSEVRGLTYGSVRNGYINIDQVKVVIDGEDVVKKNAKVDTRNRRLKCPDYILSLIGDGDKDEYIIKNTEPSLYHKFKRLAVRNGYNITFHTLRHINASTMAYLGIGDKYAMQRGGWKTDYVMKNVYQHTFEQGRIEADNAMDDYFNGIISHENTTQNI